MADGPRPIRSTYRLQLGPDLDFAGAAELVDDLAELGVSHLYLSPILQARSGSTHGYDVADPARVSADLGGEEGLRELAARAHDRGLGLVADLVPNHVGTGADNPLWEALLAEGQPGSAGSTFDVDWDTPLPGATGKVILPVLGDQYGEVLKRGELEVVAIDGVPRLRYYEATFPLSPETIDAIERSGLDGFRGTPGRPESWRRLHALLEEQRYRLVHWRAGASLVNYRRFFAIDELAAVKVEDDDVFEATHAKILELVADGVLDGLRIDHPDGLRDPGRYFARLAERTGGVWTVVEKITEPGEQLPDWPVAGTTGYELANDAVGLFVDPASQGILDALADELGAGGDVAGLIAQAKREIVEADLAADARRLSRLLWQLAQGRPEVRDVDDLACLEVVARMLQAMPVYRTYVDPQTGEAREEDRALIDAALERARDLGEHAYRLGRDLAPPALLGFFAEVLRGEAGDSPLHLEVLARFQQLSGAVMAKGVEDTAFYRHHRLVALNEVGGDLGRFGVSVAELHAANTERAKRFPQGQLTTATHDTKRGEDVRVRISTLSEVAERWAGLVRGWQERHRPLFVDTPAGLAPDPATMLLMYQTLVGVWPVGGDPDEVLRDRLAAYLQKAAREAKLRTSWTDPDEAFESALSAVVDALVLGAAGAATRDELRDLVAGLARLGAVNALGQTLLRCTSPGVPDTYQGTELWDDSLVDPDNRRPVDPARRREALAAVGGANDPAELLERWDDGRVKLHVLRSALRLRGELPEVFGPEGGYVPLETSGTHADRVVAFAREHDSGRVITVIPRLVGALTDDGRDWPLGEVWGDTAVRLPDGELVDVLSGAEHTGGDVRLATLLQALPVALLRSAA